MRFECLARCALLGSIALMSLTQPAASQTRGDGFLFKAPNGSFSLRGGYAVASAGSDLFSEVTSILTLDKRDFSSVSFGGDISVSMSPRIDLVFGGDFSSASQDSEFREFVEEVNGQDQPIRQSTNFKRLPLTGSLKYYLSDRGRSIGQFAWIPSRYAPYVGVGGGAMWYRFRQDGDFVIDPETLEIRTQKLESSGWGPTVQGMAGVDYTIGPWIALTAEGRYNWGRAPLNENVYEGFDKIDLSGFAGTMGFRVRF